MQRLLLLFCSSGGLRAPADVAPRGCSAGFSLQIHRPAGQSFALQNSAQPHRGLKLGQKKKNSLVCFF